jgi:hypothetical protein
MKVNHIGPFRIHNPPYFVCYTLVPSGLDSSLGEVDRVDIIVATDKRNDLVTVFTQQVHFVLEDLVFTAALPVVVVAKDDLQRSRPVEATVPGSSTPGAFKQPLFKLR